MPVEGHLVNCTCLQCKYSQHPVFSAPAVLRSVSVTADLGGGGGGGGEWVPIGNIQAFDEAASIAGARNKAIRQPDNVYLRERLMLTFMRAGFPIDQTMKWALKATEIGERYTDEKHQSVFCFVISARFSRPETCCDQSITDAKEATDFIISGKA